MINKMFLNDLCSPIVLNGKFIQNIFKNNFEKFKKDFINNKILIGINFNKKKNNFNKKKQNFYFSKTI